LICRRKTIQESSVPGFIIHGDASPLEATETVETRDDLARHMFVTLEPAPDKTLWIRSVPLKDLAEFKGLLYQLDRDDEQGALVLRQVQVRFWPWEGASSQPLRQTTSLDETLKAAFVDFYTVLSQPDSCWFAKERDCVNRFAMAHLVPACTPGGALYHPAQIGIEIGVKQPEGVGSRPAAPKDLVIWAQPCSTSWSSTMRPERNPLAILEWKSQRPEKAKQRTEEDREWLQAFTEENASSIGYSVFVDWSGDGVLQALRVARCQDGVWDNDWLRMP
jgi:hypothetical protein